MKILNLIITIVILLLTNQLIFAQEQLQADQSSSSNNEIPKETKTNYGEIIPEAVEFAEQQNTIEDYFLGMRDIADINSQIKEIEQSIKNSSEKLRKFRNIKSTNTNEINELGQTININFRSLEKIIDSLVVDINKLGNWREQLLVEKVSLMKRLSSISTDDNYSKFKKFLKQININLDEILGKVDEKLEPLIQSQERAANAQITIISQKSELNKLIADNEELYSSPTLFSSAYINQLKSLNWSTVVDGFYYIKWPNKLYLNQLGLNFGNLGLILISQVLLCVLIIFLIFRNRQFLVESDRWGFVSKRPFSAATFIGFMTFVPLYRYYRLTYNWEILLLIIIGIPFILIVKDVVTTSWKRQLMYGLLVLLFVVELFELISLPIPIFRLSIIFISLVAIIFCLRWTLEISSSDKQSFFKFILISISLIFGLIIVGEILGYAPVVENVFKEILFLSSKMIVWFVYIQIILGAFEWLFKNPLKDLTPTKKDLNSMIHRIAVIIYFLFGLYLIADLVKNWRLDQDFRDALEAMFSFGFNVGSIKISFGLLVTVFAIGYLTYFVSFVIKKILINAGGLNKQIEKGVRLSIANLFQYAIVAIGFLILLYILGLELTQLTIIISALGIGIGFGLQNIVNNFLSGLILLFERPIRVGDIIEMQGRRAQVKHIGLRSTVISTYDEEEVIVPNSELVSKEVTNLTLSNRTIRIKIPVGVAYGSDVSLVIKTLIACAKAHNFVAKIPEPHAMFINFGDSALNFELRVWILDADKLVQVKSELLQEIDRRFRKYNIEIAFAQWDLHIRSVNEPRNLQSFDTEE